MPTLASTTEDSRIYECCVLYGYPLNQKEEKEIQGLFAEAGAQLVSRDVWSRRGLAYPIRGATEGTFVVYHYEMDPSKLKEVETALRIAKGVLRHLVVKPPSGYVIVKYSEQYEQWLKDKDAAVVTAAKRKEDELTKKVLDRQKRKAKVTEEKAEKPAEKAPAMEKGQLDKQLDKLISDDDINL